VRGLGIENKHPKGANTPLGVFCHTNTNKMRVVKLDDE